MKLTQPVICASRRATAPAIVTSPTVARLLTQESNDKPMRPTGIKPASVKSTIRNSNIVFCLSMERLRYLSIAKTAASFSWEIWANCFTVFMLLMVSIIWPDTIAFESAYDFDFRLILGMYILISAI